MLHKIDMENDVMNRLKELMDFLGCSQARLAEKCNMSKSHFNKVMNGNLPLTDHTLMRIANAFNVNYDWLKDGIGNMVLGDWEKGKDEFEDILRMEDGDDDPDKHKSREQLVQELGELREKVIELQKTIDEKDRTINALSSAIDIVNERRQKE